MLRRTCCAAVLAAIPVVALSQAEDSVVVTATRFAEEARRLPASITVITAEDIQKSAARTLPELLQEQVGITMKDFFGNNGSNTSVDLRGFGVTGGQNTLVLLDGRRLGDIDLTSVQWAAVPLVGIERVEILRGTGAVLYGDGASAGVINIVTRSPLKAGTSLEAFGRMASLATGETQLYGSHSTGAFGINGSIYAYGSDGYRANNRNEQQNNTVNMRWALGATTLDLRIANDRQDLGLPGARRIQPSTGLDEYNADRRGAQTPLDTASRDGARAGLSLLHALGSVEVSLGLDWRHKLQRSLFVQQFTARDDSLGVWSITPRVRVPFRLGGLAHRLTFGADFHSWRYDSRRDSAVENLGRPVNRIRATQRTEALYVQDLIELGAATRLNLGLRAERARFAADDTLDAGAPGFLGFQQSAGSTRQTQRQHAWEAGVRHDFSRAYAGYVRAGRSYRFANVDEVTAEFDALGNPALQVLRPQHARTIEGGIEWRGGAHFLRAGLFRMDVTDEIHLDPFTPGVGNTNLPPSRRQGLELESSWRATPALRFTAGYAYTDARFREGVMAGGPFTFGTNLSVAGKRVPLVPEHKLNAGFAWDLGAKTRLSGALTAVSEQVMDNDEPNVFGPRIPSYAVADVKLSHEFGIARIALTVNNLFNTSYYTYAVRNQFVPNTDRYGVYPLPGRTLGVSAEFKLQ
jgi:iron complex outermembrane receptor protein